MPGVSRVALSPVPVVGRQAFHRRRIAVHRAGGGFVLLAAAFLSPGACTAPSPEVQRTVDRYILAMAHRDMEQLLDLYAPLLERLAAEPAARHAEIRGRFRQYAEARYAAYEAGKDEGHLEFQPVGIVLARALNLGRGAYYETIDVQFPDADRAVLIQEVRLAYRSIDTASLPRGTTIYLMGEPLGTIYNPVIGARQPAARRLLEKVWLRWSLVKRDGRWRVVQVEPDPARPPESYVDTRQL